MKYALGILDALFRPFLSACELRLPGAPESVASYRLAALTDQTEVIVPSVVRHITLPLGVVNLGLEQGYRVCVETRFSWLEIKRDHDLLQNSGVSIFAESPLLPPQIASIGRPELQTPISNCLVRNDDAALSKQVFDVAKAHREPMVQPDGVTDDFSWKAMPSIL